MRVAVVIPAYNEAATLREVAVRALAQCAQVYVVDDGSTDATAQSVEGLPLVLLRHARNQGKAASLWDGFAAALDAGPDWVVTLDGDGQHRPEDIPRLLAAAQQHPRRLVIAARLCDRAKAPRLRRMANTVADFLLSWAAGHPIADSQSGQRAYPAALLRLVIRDTTLRHDQRAAFTLESEILIAAARHGYRTAAVPIATIYAAGRPSHFRPFRDTGRIGWMVARRLLAARLCFAGLWRWLTERPLIVPAGTPPTPSKRTPIADTGSHG